MADKSFGVRQLNLIGIGTPTIESSDTINLDAPTVAISTNVTIGGISSVGSAITMYGSSGIISATKYYGDGSSLTGVVASGTGIVVEEEGSSVGTATTINFVGTGVTATFGSGIATVSIAIGSTFSGNYNDLSNKPTIPSDTGDLTNNAGFVTFTKVSQLNNDSGYITAGSTFSGNYNDLSNTPTIPTNNNQLTNGAGYITAGSTFSGNYNDLSNTPTIPSDTGDLTNNVGFITSGASGVGIKTSGGNVGFGVTFLDFRGAGISTITAPSSGISTINITGGGGGGGSVSEAFKTISVSGQSDVVADSATDTLTLVAGNRMTITTNASGDSITFAASASGTEANGNMNVTAGVTYQLNTYSASTYVNTEYILFFQHTSGIQSQRVLVMDDGTNAYSEEYGIMHSNDLLVSVGATLSSGTVRLQFTPEAGVSGVITYSYRREELS